MTQKRSVSLFALTGMPGAGKTVLIEQFLQKHEELRLCMSCTTGKTHEENSQCYVEPFAFAKMLRHNEFIEYSRNADGEYRGTPYDEVASVTQKGLIPLLDISVDGLAQLMKNHKIEPSLIVSAFIMPPNAQTLKERLMKRHRESYDGIILRLKAAFHELDLSCLCTGIVINDTPQSALDMMDYLYTVPHAQLSVNTDPFRQQLRQIIDEMENAASPASQTERSLYEQSSSAFSSKEPVYGTDD